MTLTDRIKDCAVALGFDAVGIAPAARRPDAAGAPLRASAYQRWVEAGYAGDMAYMTRQPERRTDVRQVMPEARSAVVVGLGYYTLPVPAELGRDPSRGLIARYAWGGDYHDVMAALLRQLRDFIRSEVAELRSRIYVDTGPILERDLAERAGLGFTGKNTCLIRPRMGSWLFLGEILVDVELEYDEPIPRLGCGTCTRCLTACPTRAFPAPYVLDARRCISYLTIELKGSIPRDLRPLMGNRIFGCDECQDVCPWPARFARPAGQPALYPVDADRIAPKLLDLVNLTGDQFRRRFEGSPILRAKRRGLLRNVCVALGNWGDPRAAPALSRALEDAEPLVRGHAAWALGRIGTLPGRTVLERRIAVEPDPQVREEILLALDG